MFTPSRDRGAAAVEFALVLPILLLLVIGILEFGRAYHVQTTLSNAARDGVRVMALQDSATAARATAKDSASGLSLTDSMIDVTPSRCTSDTTAPGQVAVTISYPFTLVSGFLPLDDFTLTGRGTMRCFG
ncbi:MULTISPECIES: TadE/TadG family type IV pilus assembly protein [Dietzia]|uniref:TadE/TadG family type IV pilus assembly protein n=1 Tax=Dietzia TaxID=37914 RepID=UPI000E74D309|nr:TadE/TadG family type IV pilus assembly protein [Dietzia kunjamensis]MBB1011048.1 pilus assembly protein [Dietzia kunjamensis]RKE62497.1 TadE-like protein [Dietzia kunjamensis]